MTGLTPARADVETDSLLEQRPVAPKKNIGALLLDIPEEILKSPIYIGKGLTWAVTTGVYRNATLRKLSSYVFSFRPSLGPTPVISYGSNAGYRFGISYTQRQVFAPGDRWRVVGSYSTNKYERYEMIYAGPKTVSETAGLNVLVSFRSRPRENFFGLGFTSRDEDKVSFSIERTTISVSVPWQLARTIHVEPGLGYVATDVFDGENTSLTHRLDEIQNEFGMSASDFRRSRLLRSGVAIVHDWRDSRGQPSRGGRELLSLEYNHGLGSSEDIRYVASGFEISHYFNIYHKRILALRVIAETVDSDSDDGILPFYLKSRLGGRDDLRGFLSSRFIDNDRTMATAEYRYPIWSMIDAFVFAEAGRVFSSLTEEFTLRDWSESFGTGLRVWREDEIVFSAQVAYSDESWRVYFELGGDW